jgi:hypothetical protein
MRIDVEQAKEIAEAAPAMVSTDNIAQARNFLADVAPTQADCASRDRAPGKEDCRSDQHPSRERDARPLSALTALNVTMPRERYMKAKRERALRYVPGFGEATSRRPPPARSSRMMAACPRPPTAYE